MKPDASRRVASLCHVWFATFATFIYNAIALWQGKYRDNNAFLQDKIALLKRWVWVRVPPNPFSVKTVEPHEYKLCNHSSVMHADEWKRT